MTEVALGHKLHGNITIQIWQPMNTFEFLLSPVLSPVFDASLIKISGSLFSTHVKGDDVPTYAFDSIHV